MAPCDVASFRVDFHEVYGRISCGGVWSAFAEDILVDGFEISDPRTWFACHEKAIGLGGERSEAVEVERLGKYAE